MNKKQIETQAFDQAVHRVNQQLHENILDCISTRVYLSIQTKVMLRISRTLDEAIASQSETLSSL